MVSVMADAAGGSMVDDGQRYEFINQRNGANVKIVMDRLESIFKTSGIFFTLDLDKVLQTEIPCTFSSYQSYILNPGMQPGGVVRAKLEFRTHDEDGLLLYHQMIDPSEVKVGIDRNGFLWYRVVSQTNQVVEDVKRNDSTCGSKMYRCDNGQCIYEAWYCDKDKDCEDGSNEKNCNHTCKEGFLMCPDDERCISTHWKCDSNNNCNDGSDELNYDHTNCTEEQYTCSTGRCISKSWLCDGDCQNGEDESSKMGCDPVVCFHDKFICANNQCIDKEYYYDKDDDCGDGSDERDCDYSIKCLDTQFECDKGYCISKELRCNGEPNCGDRSDEKDCEEPPCFNSSLYQCSNGVCLTDDLVCNGRDDCGDNSDEPGNHGINECITIKHACSQKCKDKKIGYECSCEKGFKLDTDQTSCIDIDECSTTYPCDQYCYDLHGSYYCGCAEHNELLSDKHHCRLTNEVEIESSTQSFTDGLWHGFCMYIDAAMVNVTVDRNNKASLHALAIQSTSDYFIGHSDLPVETWIRHDSMRLITVNGYQAPDCYIGKMHYETDLSGLTEAIERKSCGNVTTLD